ncbi:classical arabinogalactan protein 4 [Stenotrophomonas bentonitica]
MSRRESAAMKRFFRGAVSLAMLLPLIAAAQMPAPRKATDTRPVTPVVPAPAPLPAPVKTPAQTSQQLRTHPIQSQGPAQVVPPAPPATTAPPKVYDRHGRIVPGMKQAGPNRVLDTRTGRYYDAVPTGDGQRIKP